MLGSPADRRAWSQGVLRDGQVLAQENVTRESCFFDPLRVLDFLRLVRYYEGAKTPIQEEPQA
jgi:hypothetical protein